MARKRITIDLVINKFHGENLLQIENITLPFNGYESEHPHLVVHHAVQLIRNGTNRDSYSLTPSRVTYWNVVHKASGMIAIANFRTLNNAIAFTKALYNSDFDPFDRDTGELVSGEDQPQSLCILLKQLKKEHNI